MIDNDIKVCPGLKLPLPVTQRGQGHHDEERPTYTRHVNLLEEGDALYGLTQTHLVRQDTVLSENTNLSYWRPVLSDFQCYVTSATIE